MLIRLFRKAGTTGHVFFLKNGTRRDMGVGYSGFIGLKTAVAVVPTTPQVIDFVIEARTRDKQVITVTGDLKVALDPAAAVAKFDFTVDPASGAYCEPWEETLNAIALECALPSIHDLARTLEVETATTAHKQFGDAVRIAATSTSALKEKGLYVDSCSITRIEPNDDEVTASIGSKERQTMLTQADLALHTRRLKAAESDRGVKTYESETALKLEEERAKLLAQQIMNKQQEAEAVHYSFGVFALAQ